MSTSRSRCFDPVSRQTAHTLWVQIKHGTQAEGVASDHGSEDECVLSASATIVSKEQQKSHMVLASVPVGEVQHGWNKSSYQ